MSSPALGGDKSLSSLVASRLPSYCIVSTSTIDSRVILFELFHRALRAYPNLPVSVSACLASLTSSGITRFENLELPSLSAAANHL